MIGRVASAFMIAQLTAVSSYACPDPTKLGEQHEESGKNLYSEQTYQVRAGGEANIAQCKNVNPAGDRGSGYVTNEPDFSFKLRGMDQYKLQLEVISECDSVLLINTGSATWYYDDDDAGNLDARIELSRPANGWLDVWVGTHDGAYCDASLSLETFER